MPTDAMRAGRRNSSDERRPLPAKIRININSYIIIMSNEEYSRNSSFQIIAMIGYPYTPEPLTGERAKELAEKYLNKKARKVIFLDCDNVVNSIQWEVVRKDMPPASVIDDAIDPRCLARIVSICSETRAKIVLSSDWRINWPFARTRLERAGMPEGVIIDRTPVVPDVILSRGDEIQAWLNEHDYVYNYIIIDDRDDFLPEQRQHLVQTSPWVGITDKDKNKAIEMLATLNWPAKDMK